MKVGDIYCGHIPDPNGKPIQWPHPAMILTPPLTANPNEIIQVVGISTKLADPLPVNWIRLPYSKNSRMPATTGLDKECVLKCNWVVNVPQSVFFKKLGVMPGKELYLAMPHIRAFVESRNRSSPPSS